MKSTPINLALSREAFTYDPINGIVFWNEKRPREHFPTEHGYRCWMGRNAGKPAGSPNKDGHLYATFTLPGGKRHAIAIHHVAWMLGNEKDLPKGKHIDHLDGSRTNNRIENLRAVDPALNSRNTVRSRKPSTGYPGIYETPKGYEVRLTLAKGNAPEVIGCYNTLEGAIEARWREAFPLEYTLLLISVEN